ncbi:Flp pilus assembly complex ATPase component TadA [Patescibacteria group bacterium]|nr:Flp pilus assembly complex ATPase component TadA [Patescibacteria group bacterium]
MDNEKVKNIIIDTGLITEAKLLELEKNAKEKKTSLTVQLINEGILSDEYLGELIADNFGWRYINLKNTAIKDEVLKTIPELVAKKQQAIPFKIEGNTIKVAMNDPDNLEFIHLLEKKSGKFVQHYFATESDIKTALGRYRKSITEEFDDIIQQNVEEAKQSVKAEDLPVVRIVDTILQYAYQNGASDVHIEPYEGKSLLRYRIDGLLHDVIDLPKRVHDLLITRIKILSQLRIDEHRAAQDGKLQFMTEDGRVDVRVSTVPITEGEKVVMRLLSAKNKQYRLDDLGFSDSDLKKVNNAIKRPHGMILATGPTGSGKTTTLYAVLQILNNRDINISTIEDPVEYDMEGINQIQVNNKTNLTFANGLRSLLRQDPDIIMVGEIRDPETASIAVNSAMTGHLVLSTLHTNDAATTIPRFVDMGIEPFLVSSTINIAMAQRLVRKNCVKCLASYTISKAELAKSFDSKVIDKSLGSKKEYRLYKSKGCEVCHKSGYKGRVGLYEIIEMSRSMKELIMNKANADEIKTLAIKEGMTTMLEDGLLKVAKGITTIEEVMRVSKE